MKKKIKDLTVKELLELISDACSIWNCEKCPFDCEVLCSLTISEEVLETEVEKDE